MRGLKGGSRMINDEKTANTIDFSIMDVRGKFRCEKFIREKRISDHFPFLIDMYFGAKEGKKEKATKWTLLRKNIKMESVIKAILEHNYSRLDREEDLIFEKFYDDLTNLLKKKKVIVKKAPKRTGRIYSNKIGRIIRKKKII